MPENQETIFPLLSAAEAGRIINAVEAGESSLDISLDLNLSVETINIESGMICLGGRFVTTDQLQAILKRPAVAFAVEQEGLTPLETREGCYAKLVPTAGAPTIELSGIRMHRTSGIDPFEDAGTKAEPVVRPGDRVLDTCGGLGYTAIQARRLGARKVVSVEINQAVLELRRQNPWTREHLDDEKTYRLEGDVYQLIKVFTPNSFDSVLHDPPRFSLAGLLYGSEFIDQLHRVLAPGGRVMFYTGEPYRKGRGRDFVAGVGRRLEEAGFKVEWRSDLRAFVAHVD